MARSRNRVVVEKQQWFPFAVLSSYKTFRTSVSSNVNQTFISVCVCILVLVGMQIVSFLRHIMLPSVACLVVPCFFFFFFFFTFHLSFTFFNYQLFSQIFITLFLFFYIFFFFSMFR
jgi:hypothetical protein